MKKTYKVGSLFAGVGAVSVLVSYRQKMRKLNMN